MSYFLIECICPFSFSFSLFNMYLNSFFRFQKTQLGYKRRYLLHDSKIGIVCNFYVFCLSLYLSKPRETTINDLIFF